MLRRPFAFSMPFAGVAGLATASAGAQQQRPGASGIPDFHRALDALLARFAEASNRKDVAALAALFAEDAVLVPPGPIVAGRRDIAQAFRTRLEHGAAGLRFEVVEARAEGGDLAWAVGRFTGTVPGEGGMPQERRGNFSTLYRRQSSEGLLIRVHAFSFLQAPPPPRR
ncbi:hypothetical protein GCM10009416_47110 [Craurococcus roseus]|uniref:DUF4440 domain-containing protein n=1 Tax=Craurococcus roseus TaxID=77585 RepID=A0ABN1G4Q3_9PROT